MSMEEKIYTGLFTVYKRYIDTLHKMPGLEYCGRVIFSKEPMTPEELWFVAKNKNGHPDAEHYAKVWSSTKKYHCTYSKEVMDQLESLEATYQKTALPF